MHRLPRVFALAPVLVPVLGLLGVPRAFADEGSDDDGIVGEGQADGEAPPLSIYGFARLDVLGGDARMSDGEQPQYVMPAMEGGDGELTMTPRLSRFGLSIDEWNLRGDEVRGEGKIEIDFGGGAGVNTIRLRHAYAQLRLFQKIELLAGQTWDVVSPLVPSAQNDTQLIFAGNTGDRRPQVRLTVTPRDKLRIAVAAAAGGTLDPRDEDGDGQLEGIAAARPMVQGLVELKLPLYRRGPAMRIGVSGHASRTPLANGMTAPSRSIGGHLFLPVAPIVMVVGEMYTGANAADIGGGIGQGVNTMTNEVIHAWGGWGELVLLPTRRHLLALGGSGDAARADDLSVGDRTSNRTLYGVLRYKPHPALQLGVEYLNWRTSYKGMAPGLANRFDLHLSVLF